ncbi:hypothetical protein Fcan01_21977 [Folsomia candida]|uniref:Uncharacterized protein n=1 Tax=Folsomia candida TaxID=158441 RepID=A0A226DEY9_FOLCA|nr:hypothetical protein Fcan01_21977 [Folsomia candida]
MTNQHYFLSLLLIISVISISSTFKLQQMGSLFPSRSIIHVIGDFTVETEKSWEAHLDKFLLRNQNLPKVSRHVRLNQSIYTNSYYGSCRKNEYIFSKYFGHSVSLISFIFLHQLETESEHKDFIQTRERLSYCGENPTYNFLVLSVINHETFKISPDAASTSKLFVLQDSTESLQISVVCFACGIFPLIELKETVRENSAVLDSSWRLHNSDMQGMRIGSGALKFDPRDQTCSATQRGGKTFSEYQTCTQLALGAKFNFSDVWITGALRDFYGRTPYDYSFKIDYNVLADESFTNSNILYPASAKYSWLPHCGRRYQFKMATVSFRNPTLDDLKAIFMPLDKFTWATSGQSFTLIAMLLATYGLKTGSLKNGKFRKGIEYFIQSWQWILSSLFGQLHGTPATLRLVSNFSVFVVLCLFSFFLLGTVFYQGCMFSSLVALIPPRIPVTMESVVESKIKIITTSRIYLAGRVAVSMLKNWMLDEVITSSYNYTELYRTLTDLKAKISFVHN